MKILVTAASFSPEISGIQRHAVNMVRCLLRRPETSHVDLVVAPWQAKLVSSAGYPTSGRVTIHFAEMRQNSISRNLWHYRELSALTSELRPDIVHLSYPVPVDAGSLACPIVVTLHDLYPYEIPDNFRFPHVIFNRLVLRHCLQNADRIACVSEATMMRLRQYAPRSTWRKACVIPNCVEPDPVSAADPPLPGWNGEPFLLSVAQHRKNKNLGLLIRTFHRLLRVSEIDSRMKLIVIGIDGPETPQIRQLISEFNLGGSVFLLSGLSDPELQWCYRGCEALVLPSKTEGFGLPVAEGLLAGCRVICSDIPAFREVGGTHCSYVALGKDEEQSLATAIRAALKEPGNKPLSLQNLSYEAVSHRYISLYRTLLAPEDPLREMDQVTSPFEADSETLLFDGIRSPGPQTRRDQRGYI